MSGAEPFGGDFDRTLHGLDGPRQVAFPVVEVRKVRFYQRHSLVVLTKDAALDTKAKGRAFAIPRYRYDAIFRPLEQLLLPKPAPAPKSAPFAAPAPKPKAPLSKPQS